MSGSESVASNVVNIDSVPFTTPEEMFVVKLCASVERQNMEKRKQDVMDAEFIANKIAKFELPGSGKGYKCLYEFMPTSHYSSEWWFEKLGIDEAGVCTVHGKMDLRCRC